MGSVYKDAIALPMDSGKPIALGTKEDMEMINTYSLIQKDETKEGEQITEKKAWGRNLKIMSKGGNQLLTVSLKFEAAFGKQNWSWQSLADKSLCESID